MSHRSITQTEFLEDRQGRTFADVVNDSEQPFEVVLTFFSDAGRQQRLEDSELHHDRPPLAGVVRELESQPDIDRFLATQHPRRTKRLRQAIGVVVRMIMESRGWSTTGRKGSLGVRAPVAQRSETPGDYHNTGGLSFWFVRAERYELEAGMPYVSVRKRNRQLEAERNKAQGKVPRKPRRKKVQDEPVSGSDSSSNGKRR